MASTLPISGGIFTVPGSGSQQQLSSTTESINGVQTTVVTQSSNPSPVLANLNYQSTPGSAPANIAVSSPNNLILTNANFNFSNGNDTLVIASGLSTGAPQGGGFTAAISTNVNMGGGDNSLTIQGSAYNTNIVTGGGNDTVRVNGSIVSGRFSLGGGSDTLIFGGDVGRNVRVDLGSDGVRDVIQLNSLSNFKGFRVTGADSNDVLLIGSSQQFQYDQASGAWVNSSNPTQRIIL